MTTNRNSFSIKFTPEYEEELKKGPIQPGEREKVLSSTSSDKSECEQAYFKAMSYNLRLFFNSGNDAKSEDYVPLPQCCPQNGK